MALHSLTFQGTGNKLYCLGPPGINEGVWQYSIQSCILQGKQTKALCLGFRIDACSYFVEEEKVFPLMCLFRADKRTINGSSYNAIKTAYADVTRRQSKYEIQIINLVGLELLSPDIANLITFTVLVHFKRRA